MQNELLEPTSFEKELQTPTCETRDKFTEDDYLQMLNEAYGEINICGQTFDAGSALKELDPTAFDVGFGDYQEYVDVYLCPICEAEHEEDEDGAKYCCQSDATIYVCPVCGEEHEDDENGAKYCCQTDETDEVKD